MIDHYITKWYDASVLRGCHIIRLLVPSLLVVLVHGIVGHISIIACKVFKLFGK
jgi:hypothetical protein